MSKQKIVYILENESNKVLLNSKHTLKNNMVNTKKKYIFFVLLIAFALLGMSCKNIENISKGIINNNFKSSANLEVQVACVANDEGHFIVKNIGEEVITDFTLVYVGYDTSGNILHLGYETVYKTIEFKTANILPGATYGLDKYIYLGNSSVKYIDTVVSQITFKNGSDWNAGNLDLWVEKSSNEFSVEDYKQNIEEMKTLALIAEDNPYLKIINSIKYSDNQFSSKDDMDISLMNIGEKDIKNFSVIVMQYDKNGFGIGVSPYIFVTLNSRIATCDPANIIVGDNETWNWSLFFESDCDKYKLLICSIEFKDGTNWINEYALQWMLYNEDMR